jgi:hypothetical protein
MSPHRAFSEEAVERAVVVCQGNASSLSERQHPCPTATRRPARVPKRMFPVKGPLPAPGRPARAAASPIPTARPRGCSPPSRRAGPAGSSSRPAPPSRDHHRSISCPPRHQHRPAHPARSFCGDPMPSVLPARQIAFRAPTGRFDRNAPFRPGRPENRVLGESTFTPGTWPEHPAPISHGSAAPVAPTRPPTLEPAPATTAEPRPPARHPAGHQPMHRRHS